MSKSKSLMKLCEGVEISYKDNTNSSSNTTPTVTQFTAGQNYNKPVGNTQPKLEAGVYKIGSDMSGVFFAKHKFATDELLRFRDSSYEKVLKEIEEFWKMRDAFKQFGFTHSRGMILEGYPGTGKSCLIKIMMEQIVASGDIVFSVKDMYTLVEGLKQFREVEPERKAFVVLEDVDGIITYSERELLELMDGDSQIDGIMYIATTNYIDRIPPRLTRAGRFDKVVNIGFPPYEGRLEYLKHKLSKYETESSIVELANSTDGLGFNHLKELILRVYVFKEDLHNSIKSLQMTLPAEIRPALDSYIDSKLSESMSSIGLLIEDESSVDAIKTAFTSKIDKLNFDGVQVSDVSIDPDGDISVSFTDSDGDEMEVLFGVDYSGAAFAMIMDMYDDEEAIIIVDLGPVNPVTFENEFGTTSIDLVNLSWLNTTTLDTILRAGEIVDQIMGGDIPLVDPNDQDGGEVEIDAFGNPIVKYNGESFGVRVNSLNGKIYERMISRVIRGGKQLRIPIIKSEARGNLTFKQKESLSKAKKVSKSRNIKITRK